MTDNTINKYDENLITTKKLSASKWNLLEKPLSDEERARNLMILSIGENILTENNLMINQLTTIGDYYYKIVRDKLSDIINFTELNFDNNKKKEKINKATATILNNKEETINKKLEVIKKLLKDKPEKKNF